MEEKKPAVKYGHSNWGWDWTTELDYKQPTLLVFLLVRPRHFMHSWVTRWKNNIICFLTQISKS